MTERPLANDRLLRALRREPVDCTPIWVMRQAGRYLPEYRATRQRAGNFLNLCKTPELACEVTLQPLERFALDAAILFSDILTIPDAMGLGLTLNEGEGPRFQRPVRSEADIKALGIPDPETDLRYVTDAVRTIVEALSGRVPLIGFSGSPWTLATYMIEGQSTRDFARIKKMMYGDPALLHRLLDVLAESVIEYLKSQIRAGVDVVMVFDTWGGVLSWHDYEAFSLHYLSRIVAGLRADPHCASTPCILFTKGGGQWLEQIADTGCDGVGCDWTTSLARARQQLKDRVAIQGNLDPAVLLTDPSTIRREVKRVLDDFGDGEGHIFNLGHGITPQVDPDNAGALIDAVHELSRRPAKSD